MAGNNGEAICTKRKVGVIISFTGVVAIRVQGAKYRMWRQEKFVKHKM